jgi:acyl carrier protein
VLIDGVAGRRLTDAHLQHVIEAIEEVVGEWVQPDADLSTLEIDSLGAQQIAARLEELHDVVIDLGDAVACATPLELAALVKASPPSDLPPLPRRDR